MGIINTSPESFYKKSIKKRTQIYDAAQQMEQDGADFIDLNVKIVVDLNDVDEKYHETFVNVLTSKYLGVVSFGDNPFSRCEPSTKKYWWQFWK